MKTILALLAIVYAVRIANAQTLPESACKVIEARYPHWRFRPNHIPNPCDQYGIGQSSFPAIRKCNLNGDGKADYMVAIMRGRGPSSVEYFLALISTKDEYNLYLLDTVKYTEGGGQKIMVLIPAGEEVSFFSNETLIMAHGKMTPDGTVILPTGVIEIYPACESRWKEIDAYGFVYIGEKFVMFNAAD